MRSRMSARRTLAVLMAGLPLAWSPPCRAAGPAFDPKAVAVTIQRTPAQSWAGYGIYLGNGLVITAAHVAGAALLTHPNVVVDGQTLPTVTIKEGSYPDNDLALLRVAPPFPHAWADRHTTVCTNAPRPDEAVIVATPEQTTYSIVISPEVLPPDLRGKYSSSIRDVYTTGNSGSGVFDAFDDCLLGIMSSKIEQQQRVVENGAPVVRTVGLAKHFVPAADIQAFLVGVSNQ